MNNHLSVAFTQGAIDRVLDDITYPCTVQDDHEPFDENQLLANGGDYPSMSHPNKDIQPLFAWAEQNTGDPQADELLAARHDFLKLIDDVRESKKQAGDHHWTGPSEEALSEMAAMKDWDLQFHLAWIRVILKSKPSVALAAPITDLNDIRVKVGATGQLWAKHPWVKCIKQCHIGPISFCCEWKKVWKWTRLVSLTLQSVDIRADARLSFEIQNDTNLVAIPRFKKLRIDEGIFNAIPLEDLANRHLKKKDEKLLLLERSDLEIDLDELKLKYLPKTLAVSPASGRLPVEVQLHKV